MPPQAHLLSPNYNHKLQNCDQDKWLLFQSAKFQGRFVTLQMLTNSSLDSGKAPWLLEGTLASSGMAKMALAGLAPPPFLKLATKICSLIWPLPLPEADLLQVKYRSPAIKSPLWLT